MSKKSTFERSPELNRAYNHVSFKTDVSLEQSNRFDLT